MKWIWGLTCQFFWHLPTGVLQLRHPSQNLSIKCTFLSPWLFSSVTLLKLHVDCSTTYISMSPWLGSTSPSSFLRAPRVQLSGVIAYCRLSQEAKSKALQDTSFAAVGSPSLHLNDALTRLTIAGSSRHSCAIRRLITLGVVLCHSPSECLLRAQQLEPLSFSTSHSPASSSWSFMARHILHLAGLCQCSQAHYSCSLRPS